MMNNINITKRYIKYCYIKLWKRKSHKMHNKIIYMVMAILTIPIMFLFLKLNRETEELIVFNDL